MSKTQQTSAQLRAQFTPEARERLDTLRYLKRSKSLDSTDRALTDELETLEKLTSAIYEAELSERPAAEALSRKATIAKLAAVAKLLGATFKPDKIDRHNPPVNDTVYELMTLPTWLCALLLRANGHNHVGKVTIDYMGRARDTEGSAVYAKDVVREYATLSNSATMALTKTPEQIAADIKRRVIPNAEKLHGLFMAALAQCNTHLTNKQDFPARFEKRANKCRGMNVTYWNEDSATVRIDLNAEQLDAVLTALGVQS